MESKTEMLKREKKMEKLTRDELDVLQDLINEKLDTNEDVLGNEYGLSPRQKKKLRDETRILENIAEKLIKPPPVNFGVYVRFNTKD